MDIATPYKQTAESIRARVLAGEWRARDVASFYIERTRNLAPLLNSHLYWNEAEIRAQAEAVDRRVQAGEKPLLAGVPIVLKDNISTAGVPTTCGSRMLQDYRPPYDAWVVERLKAAGAVILAKTNLDEFAMGSSNENSAFGAVKNPWDLERVAGGSSGGSAAAVAADLAPVALGSDTGGSVRQPAAFCGVVGLKPSYGRVSRYGLIAYGSSLDQIGPLSRTVADAALLLDAISGHDARDATCSVEGPTMLHGSLQEAPSLKGLRIGYVRELVGEGLETGVRTSFETAIAAAEKDGATVEEISIPHLRYSIAAYYLVATAEASSNLARFDGVRYGYRAPEAKTLPELYGVSRSQGFGDEVKQRIMLGTFALSSGYYDAYYAKAARARALLAQDFDAAFAKVDLLISPTTPTPAFLLGERIADPLAMYLSDICTIAPNLAGIPAISIPLTLDHGGLPIGLQLMAPRFLEERLLKGAYAFERHAGFYDKYRPQPLGG